ncbi:MAG: endolytic transglycosylase MltG [Ruthenibacterium sp.]
MARRRRKRNSGGHGCLIAVLVVLAIIVIAGVFAFSYVNSDIKGKRGDAAEATILVEKGSGPLTIGKQLQEAGLIKNAQIFRFYVKNKGAAETMQYGEFTLTSDMSYDAMIESMQKTTDDRETVSVTFPEGIPAVQFASRMEQAGLCSAQEFLDVANTGDFSQFKFWAKRDISADAFMACEGFLFPETYQFFKGDTVYNMVAKIYGEFDKRVSDEMYGQIEAMGFNLSQFVTLSSIVQEEAGNVAHQADVAAVFMARLAPGSIEGRLQSNCASYIQNDNDNNYVNNTIAKYYGGWDKTPQNIIDKYDTYNHVGLPAGPISNPGIDAMVNTIAYKSAEYYNEADPYYFFVTDTEGNYYFNRTANEHLAICQKLGLA